MPRILSALLHPFSLSPDYSRHTSKHKATLCRMNVNMPHIRESSKLYSYLLIGAQNPYPTTIQLTTSPRHEQNPQAKEVGKMPFYLASRPFPRPFARLRASGHLSSFIALKILCGMVLWCGRLIPCLWCQF